MEDLQNKLTKCKIVSIKKIKLIDKNMYDLETKKNHNFFANGILVHNSGTATRDDGNEMMIFSSVGDIIYKLGAKELVNRGYLIRPNIVFFNNYMSEQTIKEKEQQSKVGLINETEDYNIYYKNFISENIFRNNIIRDICLQNSGKKILILTKLIEHGEILKNMIEGSEHLWGETKKDIRKDILDKFINGDLDILISTISIFSEGIDLPALQIVINASANAGDVKTIQVLGRVLRMMEGKNNASYYDFVDESKFFKRASFKRRKALINQEHNVEILKWLS